VSDQSRVGVGGAWQNSAGVWPIMCVWAGINRPQLEFGQSRVGVGGAWQNAADLWPITCVCAQGLTDLSWCLTNHVRVAAFKPPIDVTHCVQCLHLQAASLPHTHTQAHSACYPLWDGNECRPITWRRSNQRLMWPTTMDALSFWMLLPRSSRYLSLKWKLTDHAACIAIRVAKNDD